MAYESQITFTLDTICPWTYLAHRRLHKALSLLPDPSPATFTLTYAPYQLYPETTHAGQDRTAWYKNSRYGDSEEKWTMYTRLMTAYGRAEGIEFKFGGTVANTLHAHRVIQHFQDMYGGETADGIVRELYRAFFEEDRHPSSQETLVGACIAAGVGEEEAKGFVTDEERDLKEVEARIAEQKGNGVDAVPVVVMEGKRRDLTFVGCKEVEEYRKGLEQIIKESQ